MAPFNPSPGQPNDPNFLRYSQPTPESQPDTSKGMALKTAGEGIQGAVAIADQGIKGYIHDTAYDKIDTERDEFTSGLEKIKTQLNDGVIPPAVKTADGNKVGGSVFDANASMDDSELPVGLGSGLDRITQLTLAKANGAMKLNDTQYSGNVLGIAKQLRAQFPGYRDYIDETVSRASGLPVANSYYQNMLYDINRQMMGMAQRKDDVGTLMKSNLDVPNMASYMIMRQNNDPKYPGDAFVLKQIGSWQNLQSTQKIDAAERAANKDNQNVQLQKDRTNLTSVLNDHVAHYISDNLALTGMPSLRELTQYFQDAASGRIKTTDAEVQQRGVQLQAYLAHIQSELKKTSNGYDGLMGGEEADKMIKSAMTPIQTYADLVNAKDGPLGVFHLNQAAAIQNDDKYNMLTNKDTSAVARQLLTARGIFGEQYFPTYIQRMLSQGMDKPINDLFTQEGLNAVAPVTDTRGQPVQRYMKDAIKHGKEVNVPDMNYYGHVVELANGLLDKNMGLPAKDNLIEWTFGKGNYGVLDELKMDYQDPKTGNMVPGKYRAYNVMTSNAMSQSVAEASRVKPENYQKYENWATSQYESLFRQDLITLNRTLGQNKSLGFHTGYDDVNHRFMLLDQGGRDISKQPPYNNPNLPASVLSPAQGMTRDALNIVNRINGDSSGGGISNLYHVFEHDPRGAPMDINAHVLNLVRKSIQDDPNNFVAKNMGMAVVNTLSAEQQNRELEKKTSE